MQPLAKYDQIFTVLPMCAAEEERQTEAGKYIECVAHFIAIGQAPWNGQNIVDLYEADVPTMVRQWLDYYYHDTAKPEWLKNIEGP